MIECIIDGVKALPDTRNKIKVTYENPYVKDSGSYTYEISFPLAIDRNKKCFGHVERLDVNKQLPSYEDCKLYVDNLLVMSGKGTVKSINNETLKLQIIGGASRIKYNSKWENHFIDEIDYDEAIIIQGMDETYKNWVAAQPIEIVGGGRIPYVVVNLNKSEIVGHKGIFCLSPIFDETNNIMANCLFRNHNSNNEPLVLMYNLAPQPYYIYILRKVLKYEGYSIIRNDFDKDPWNRLVIANTHKTGKLKYCLPHWSVYNFIEETRKLFNAAFVFDEEKKTVSIEARNELLTNDAVSYECEDEFTAEFDEDGLKNIATSNIEYEMSDSANRNWWEVVSREVRRQFNTVDYYSWENIVAAAAAMTKRQRQTTIFHSTSDDSYWIWGDYEDDSGKTVERAQRIGFFSPIIRDINSDESVTLRISPVAMYERKKVSDTDDNLWFYTNDDFKDHMVVIPSASNITEAGFNDMSTDDSGNYYISVKDAMEGASLEEQETDDESVMQVYFVGNNIRFIKDDTTYKVGTDKSKDGNWWWPITYTDANMFPGWVGDNEYASLSLKNLPHRGENMSELIDKHNQITIKFVCDDVPNPTLIYIFKGKRYICEKIEMNVSENGIDSEKTGYFYEYL